MNKLNITVQRKVGYPSVISCPSVVKNKLGNITLHFYLSFHRNGIND